MMMASGVSSTMISTPVAASRVRMLRPSRPMILPLTSSLSMLNIDTQFSMACSVAVRCIDSITIFLASLAAVSLASSMMSFTSAEALDSASSFRVWMSCSRASSTDSRATFSRAFAFSCTFASRSSLRLRTMFIWASTFSFRLSSSASLRFICSICLERLDSRCLSLFSLAMSWFFLRLFSSSNSLFSFRYFSLASSMRSFLIVSAASSASFMINFAFSSCSRVAFLFIRCKSIRPANTPTANAAAAVMRMGISASSISIIGRGWKKTELKQG